MSSEDYNGNVNMAGPSKGDKRKRRRCLIACENCQLRKSRCDLLSETGCHRCNILDIPCTLAQSREGYSDTRSMDDDGVEGQPTGSNIPVSITTTQNTASKEPECTAGDTGRGGKRRRLRVSEPTEHTKPSGPGRRSDPGNSGEDVRELLLGLQESMMAIKTQTMDIKSMMRQNNTGQGGSAPRFGSYSSRSPPSPRDMDCGPETYVSPSCSGEIAAQQDAMYGPAYLRSPLAQVFRVIQPRRAGFVDPVHIGLVTESEFQAAYRTFKQAFVHTLPSLRVYPGLGGSVPTHPFLRCAVLYYVIRLPRPSNLFDRATRASVDRLVERSWLAINAPSTEIDTIEALLIIASAPSKPVLDGHVGTGELELNGDRGMAMTAYHLALRLGLNDDVRRVSNHMGTAENSQSDYWPAMNRLCLWFSVVHKHAWTTIQSGAGPMLEHVYFDEVVTPLTFRQHHNIWYKHLVAESRLLRLVRPISQLLDALRLSSTFWDDGTVARLEHLFAELRVDLGTWRDMWLESGSPALDHLRLLSHMLPLALAIKTNLELDLAMHPPVQSDQAFQHIRRIAGMMAQKSCDLVREIATSSVDFSRQPGLCLSFALFAVATVLQMRANSSDLPVNLLQDLNKAVATISEATPQVIMTLEGLKDPIPNCRIWVDSLRLAGPAHHERMIHAATLQGAETLSSDIFADVSLMLGMDWAGLMNNYQFNEPSGSLDI